MNKRSLDGAARKRRWRATHPHVGKPPSFIAIDGEGRNIAGVGSEHLYTLLAASDGAYYENVKDGLSTYECLEFLVSEKLEHPNAVFCGFAFNYDVNMMLRDVPHATLERLWKRGSAIYSRDGGSMYRLSYIPSKWFRISQVVYADEPERDKNGRLFFRKVALPGRTVTVWDVWGFFQKRFTSVLQEWMPERETGTDFITLMKEKRGSFDTSETESIREYCLEECRLLVEVMDKLASALWDAGLPISQWLGAGAIASTMLKQHGIKDTLEWQSLPKGVRDASLWAYFGGRVEIFQQGILPRTVYDYDIRSAYPSTIATLPNIAHSSWFHLENRADWQAGLLGDNAWGLVHVRWDTRGHPLEWLAPFPQHFESGSVGWEAVGEGWYHVSEWRAAMRVFGNRILADEAWVLSYRWDDKPFSFVRDVYTTRAAYKAADDPRHYPLKVGLNSLYGKLAQSMKRDDQRQPPYQNFFLAGAVTAATRARVLTMLAEAGRNEAVMVATDGVFTTRLLNDSLSVELGGLELSETPPGMTLVQPGVFWERPGEGRTVRTRTRGFGVKSVTYEDAASLFTFSAKTKHVYSETRFIGMGYCISTGDWRNWRRWVTLERNLSRSLEPHRWTLGNHSIDDTHRYVMPGTYHDPAKRRPYKTRQERMQEPTQEQIDALQESEQPEGAGR